MSTGHHLVKRVVPIIIVVVILVGAVVAGAGIRTAAYIKASSVEDRVDGLEDSYTKIVSNIENLEQRYSDVKMID